MRILIELIISSLILLSFTFLLYYFYDREIENIEEIKLKIYEIFTTYNFEIRNYAFLNESHKIEDLVKENVPQIYDVKILICSEKEYESCFKKFSFFSNKNVFSISYFLASNFTHFENLEIIAYVWKKI